MAENEGLERVVRIEKKLDALSISVDERFNEVRDHFVEQREYIEFAFDRLDKRNSEGLARLEKRMSEGFAAVDQRFAAVDQRFAVVNQRFAAVDQRFTALDQRMSDGFTTMDQRITKVRQELTEGLSRVERKLDQFIESQSRPKVTRRARPSRRRR